MKKITDCLGENIRRLRLERGLTQAELAQEAGVSTGFLHNIEGGKRWVGPKTIALLARTLKVPEPDLFTDCDARAAIDPKDVLRLMCEAFGIQMSPEQIRALKVRAPYSFYSTLNSSMPAEVCAELTRLCQSPDWDWQAFLRAGSRGARPKGSRARPRKEAPRP